MKTQEKNKYKKSRNPFKSKWNGVPAILKQTTGYESLYESFVASLIWHILGALLIWGITFAFIFFGIAPKIFPKPKQKMQDIEFIIKNPKHRIRHHGIRVKQSTKDLESAPKTEPINKISSDILPTHDTRSKGEAKSVANRSRKTKPKAGGSHSKSDIPDFAIPTPSLKSMSSGLGNGSGKGRHHASGFESSTSSFGTSEGPSSGGRSSGNGAGFDKNTARKMIAPYDISPYVSELKRNVRWNWKAPKGHEGKRVELFLRIAKDGRAVILNVKRTSEIGEVDNAALNAVRKCMPLNPLPSKYTKSYLDLVFTFDSGTNSVGSRY